MESDIKLLVFWSNQRYMTALMVIIFVYEVDTPDLVKNQCLINLHEAILPYLEEYVGILDSETLNFIF